MKLEIYLVDEIWARVIFHGDNENDRRLGILSPARAGSLPEIIRAARLAGWSIQWPEGGEDEMKRAIGLCLDCGQKPATFEGLCADCNEMDEAVEEAEQLHYERWLNGEED